MAAAVDRAALAIRMDKLQEDLRQAQQEANSLRRKNAALEHRLQRKDERISELLEEKFGLADQFHQQQQQGLSGVLAKLGQGSVAATISQELQKPPRVPELGFNLLPVDAKEFENEKKAAVVNRAKIPKLQRWLAEEGASKLKPNILKDTPYLQSLVPDEERRAHEKLKEDYLAGAEVDANTGSNLSASSAFSPDARRGSKRRRLASDEPSYESSRRRDLAAFGRDTPERQDEVRRYSVPYHQIHKDRMYRGPHFRRKAVCMHCWTTNQLCDFFPQCEACRTDGVRCVRKLCGDGKECFNRRCPCLHPGDWDEKDPEYTVEEGRTPRT